MNKTDLINDLSQQFDLPKNKTDEIVTAVLDKITKTLAKKETVTFVGFGAFSVKKRAARNGRNPQTGATIKIPARHTVRFSVGKILKEKVNKK